MGKRKVTDDLLSTMKILYSKGLLTCEEIGNRYELSRQTVAVALKTAGVNTSKHKLVVQCSECGADVDKTRAEVRKHKEHFCSVKCYAAWLKRPEVQAENIEVNRIREDVYTPDPWAVPGVHLLRGKDGKVEDALIFPTREAHLEWMRTGFPMEVVRFSNREKCTYSIQDLHG